MTEGLELRHLRSFAVLAEELNFGRAAARLYVSQSARGPVSIFRGDESRDPNVVSRCGGTARRGSATSAVLPCREAAFGLGYRPAEYGDRP